MPARTYSRKAHVHDREDLAQATFSQIFDGPGAPVAVLSPSNDLATPAGSWTHDDAGAFRGIEAPEGAPSSTSMGPAQEIADQGVTARHKRGQRLALQLLDLEWTTLSPDQRRAVNALLQVAIAGRSVLP